MCGCLPPAQKRGLGGVGSEASIAPYPIVRDPAGSFPWFRALCMGDDGRPCVPLLPALLGELPVKIIQYEQKQLEAFGVGREREGCWGGEEAKEGKGEVMEAGVRRGKSFACG